MNKFPKSGTGEDWATVKAGYDKLMDKLMSAHSPDQLIELASYMTYISEKAIEIDNTPSEPGEVKALAIPIVFLKTLLHLSQSPIIDTLARLEAEHNAKAARAASQ